MKLSFSVCISLKKIYHTIVLISCTFLCCVVLTFGFTRLLYEFNEGAGSGSTFVNLINGSLNNIAVTLGAKTKPVVVSGNATGKKLTDIVTNASSNIHVLILLYRS